MENDGKNLWEKKHKLWENPWKTPNLMVDHHLAQFSWLYFVRYTSISETHP